MTTQSDVRSLEDWMRQRLRGRIAGLRLGLREDGVVLTGRTTSYYAKQIAQHTLLNATSLPLLANEIEVDRNSFPYPHDAFEDS